jgi:hypothetical protein
MIDEQEIIKELAQKIYEIRVARGIEGTELDDWFSAELAIEGIMSLHKHIVNQKEHKSFYDITDE